ncbi:MAG: hypothetical protein HOI89_11060 [Phycisphaerae bacterium]|nr:hypothetical protein [Phycisphaerae bacterium]MBT5658308.1 hypothetical protein [Phycisphaerae bacterium]
MNAIRRTSVLGLVAVLLQGCLSGSSPVPAVIEVRDAATGKPVPQAMVRTTGGNLFIPPRDVLGPPVSPKATPAGGRASTNNAGTANLVLAGNRPNELTVTAVGYLPLRLVLKAGSTRVSGATEWTRGREQPVNTSLPIVPTLEVRVHPAQ